MLARVRVFLCTYRRNRLLVRALNSLLGQTFKDWVCELHNDDPGDPFPEQLANEIADSRITVMNHDRNWGPTRTLNVPFSRRYDEEFLSLLEDDNWWEPSFLAEMTAVLDSEPDVNVAWSDMHLWQEESDGFWTDTTRTIWTGRVPQQDGVRFTWPQRDSWRSATHSHGAMLVRAEQAMRYQVPAEIPVAAIEHTRERAFDYPILLVNRPLANFAITRHSARGKSTGEWAFIQTLLAESFFAHMKLTPSDLKQIWKDARCTHPPVTNTLITVALRNHGCRKLLREVKAIDWIRWLKSTIRRPVLMCQILFGNQFPSVEKFLLEQARRRNA